MRCASEPAEVMLFYLMNFVHDFRQSRKDACLIKDVPPDIPDAQIVLNFCRVPVWRAEQSSHIRHCNFKYQGSGSSVGSDIQKSVFGLLVEETRGPSTGLKPGAERGLITK